VSQLRAEAVLPGAARERLDEVARHGRRTERRVVVLAGHREREMLAAVEAADAGDRKSTRLNSSHLGISYAVFCLKKKTNHRTHSSALPRTTLLSSTTVDTSTCRTNTHTVPPTQTCSRAQ